MYAHINQFSPNFMDKAVLTVETQDTFVTFRTFDAIHGRSQKIYLRISSLFNWLEDEDRDTFMEHDIHSFMRFVRGNETIRVEFVSLRENNGELRGFIHRFKLDPVWLSYVLTTKYEEHKTLITIREENCQARLQLPASTQKHIRKNMLADKRIRRAFVKAISQSFMYGKEHSVLLVPDDDGFFFRESIGEKRGICGGLFIWKKNVTGKDGNQHDSYYFSIHT